ncbi:MAG: acylphosphatase [Proteobacteria bacterium]|nr:acylphosphatase [Pseudomonadota bacterium]
MTTELTHLRLKIQGRVQGVGYRDHIVAEATKLGIDGWVRNRSDGSVEALVSGPDAAVQTLVGLCIKGTGTTVVKDIEMHKAEPPAEKGFSRRPSL